MKKVSWIVVIAGAVVGLAAVALTHLGNPANMGFCIACFLRDIAGAIGLHSAGKVQYVRPEIIGLVLGSLCAALAERGILGGLPLEGGILWCCTECNSKQEIDRLISALQEVCAK